MEQFLMTAPPETVSTSPLAIPAVTFVLFTWQFSIVPPFSVKQIAEPLVLFATTLPPNTVRFLIVPVTVSNIDAL